MTSITHTDAPIDSAAILAYADAAYEQLDTDYRQFVRAVYEVHKSQAYKPLYETMQEYVEKRFARRMRSTQEYLRVGRLYDEFPETRELEYSKARLLAGRITKETVNDDVRLASCETVAELRERIGGGEGTRPVLYRIAASFADPEDARTVQEVIDLGKKVVGADSIHAVLVAMCQDVRVGWEQMAYENERLDPVTKATFERDGWQCQGCGVRHSLHRHSHLKAHSDALVEDCVTLCAKCHRLFHDEQAGIEWLGPGKIRFVRKEGKE